MKTYKYQKAYADRNNLVSKSYKLNKDIVSEFKKACDKTGISQAKKLQEMMLDFISKTQ